MTDTVISDKKKGKLNKYFFKNGKGVHLNHSILNNAFLSFADEDVSVAESVYHKLLGTKLNVWFSRVHLHTSDSIIGVINEAISKSKYGIVLISKHTLKDKKHFPVLELKALLNRQLYKDLELMIIYHNITHDDILEHFPLLSDNYAVSTSEGLDTVVQKIMSKINGNSDN